MVLDGGGATRIGRTSWWGSTPGAESGSCALRDRLRCKEIWVVGAHEWRNPDRDLPADFEAHRAEHYEMPADHGHLRHYRR